MSERRTGINFGFLVQLITIAGALYVIFAKPQKWDAACVAVEGHAKQLAAMDTRITILETTSNDHYDSIMRELHAIDRKVGR